MATADSAQIMMASGGRSENKCSCKEPKNKIIEFYIHGIISGPNSTLLHIAGPGSASNPIFGTQTAFDDFITEGSEINSTEIGRWRGVVTVVSLTGTTFLFSLSAVWTQKYNGTISIVGTRGESSKYLPIVGGTGDFVGASGVATAVTITPPGSNIYTIHYTLNMTFT